MSNNYGIQKQANPNRDLTVHYQNKTWYRYPIRTHLVQLGESLEEVLQKYAAQEAKPTDILLLSEKLVGITQKRVVHESEIKASWLAVLISKFVVKYKDDVGWENPKKIQVAINEAGWLKSIFAVAFGGIMKFIFRQPGWYYRIMGKDIAAIDGFNPIAIPPFNEYATLAPARPNQVCEQLASKFHTKVAIVDASNVAIHILGKSKNIEHSDEELAELMQGNPMGQGREQTPIILLRQAN